MIINKNVVTLFRKTMEKHQRREGGILAKLDAGACSG